MIWTPARKRIQGLEALESQLRGLRRGDYNYNDWDRVAAKLNRALNRAHAEHLFWLGAYCVVLVALLHFVLPLVL